MKRQQIMDSLETLLKTIKKDNGYATNIGREVYQWKTGAITSDEVIICDKSDNVIMDAISFHNHRLNIVIQLFIRNKNIKYVRDAIDDVYVCLGTAINRGGLSYNMTWEGDEIEVEQGEDILFIATISITCNFRTMAWQRQ